jgi:hypothetical protein
LICTGMSPKHSIATASRRLMGGAKEREATSSQDQHVSFVSEKHWMETTQLDGSDTV